jgi:transcriptional regulator with XRE-family HTH domain
MPRKIASVDGSLQGHALRNARLRQRSLARAQSAPPLAQIVVRIRADVLGLTRLEFVRRSGLSRGTLRDLELGIHVPTRRVLQKFVTFCERSAVPSELIEEVRRLYAGPGETLGQLIARLELKAGSPRELARRVGISPATLWEYQRGNFPLPVALLEKMCKTVSETFAPAEELWFQAERQRLLERGYPEPLAHFWTLCARKGHAEKHLLELGLSTPTVRRLRYLELPDWADVARIARLLCRDDAECRELEKLWRAGLKRPTHHDEFGPGIKYHRKVQGIGRRELADLFGIGGKKPARILKYIEEDGFYSARAHPAGLVALLVAEPKERDRLLNLWRQRREQFHRRHRPEIRIPLRLTRELYGFGPADMEPILGYSNLEYQRIERGVSPLQETALERIQQAIHRAGEKKIEALKAERARRLAERTAWRVPVSVTELIGRLARREGGLIPLARVLRKAGLKGLWVDRLRAITRGQDVPPWCVVEQVTRAAGITEVDALRDDWNRCFRAQLLLECPSPLGIEVRVLIAEIAPTLRTFSPRLGFNYSVLVRNLQRIDSDQAIRWPQVERILRAAGLSPEGPRWREIHALWYTASDRRKHQAVFNRSNGTSFNGRPTPERRSEPA